MGIQDRDYYREHWRKQQAGQAETVEPKSEPLRARRDPPRLWGADWHWSLKLLVWLFILVLMLAARRLLM